GLVTWVLVPIAMVIACSGKKAVEGGGGASKTTEAVENVRKIAEGARAYYEEHHEFPPSVRLSPARGTCCASPGQKCVPDPTLWENPTWKALRFSMDVPHYYLYEFKSTGTGKDAKFSVAAHGDLDCDNTFSTFEMVGGVDADGHV